MSDTEAKPTPDRLELEKDAQFQFDNVAGWMSVKDYECALIKARFLIKALEALVNQ